MDGTIMSSINLSHIHKSYGNAVIVPDLSLEIHEHEFISLLGPSGCGKTTVLRMIAGLEPPTSGRILIGDQVVFDDKHETLVPPEKRHLGMVFQSYAIWPHMTVFNNVAFPLRCQKKTKSEIQSSVKTALENVQMETLSQRKPHQLSGGQQQRVALARALVSQPKVILLDEPLSNLDANLRDEMCDELEKLHSNTKMTMIYVTHDQSEAFRLSDRIAVMNEGKIEQLDQPDALRSAPKSEFVKKFLKL